MNKTMNTEEMDDMFLEMIHGSLNAIDVKDKENHDDIVTYFGDPEKCTMDHFYAPFIGKKGLYDSDMFDKEYDEEEEEEEEEDKDEEEEEEEEEDEDEEERDRENSHVFFNKTDYDTNFRNYIENERELAHKRRNKDNGLLIPRCEFEIARYCFECAREEVFMEYMDEYNVYIKVQEDQE